MVLSPFICYARGPPLHGSRDHTRRDERRLGAECTLALSRVRAANARGSTACSPSFCPPVLFARYLPRSLGTRAHPGCSWKVLLPTTENSLGDGAPQGQRMAAICAQGQARPCKHHQAAFASEPPRVCPFTRPGPELAGDSTCTVRSSPSPWGRFDEHSP